MNGETVAPPPDLTADTALTAPRTARGESAVQRPESSRTVIGPTPDEEQVLAKIRAGDEAAFVRLIERYGGGLRRVALIYAAEAAVDDLVQETWLAVLRGIHLFEGRSSLRTWMVRILINIARARGRLDEHSIPFSAFADSSSQPEAALPPERFQGPDDKFPGGWLSFPEHWDERPEVAYLSAEGVDVVRQAIASLPPAQREVVTLRDVEGWSAAEVSEALRVSSGNQRVLLHRGRSRIRAALERDMLAAGVGRGGHPNLAVYLDSEARRRAFDAHVAKCAECQAWLADVDHRLARITCAEFVEMATQFLDDAVDLPMRTRIDRHLHVCDGCRSYLGQLRSTLETIGRTRPAEGDDEPSEDVRAGLSAAFRLWRHRAPAAYRADHPD
jgi:RNA polymerase sigma-70 factor (ECF subfamily)